MYVKYQTTIHITNVRLYLLDLLADLLWSWSNLESMKFVSNLTAKPTGLNSDDKGVPVGQYLWDYSIILHSIMRYRWYMWTMLSRYRMLVAMRTLLDIIQFLPSIVFGDRLDRFWVHLVPSRLAFRLQWPAQLLWVLTLMLLVWGWIDTWHTNAFNDTAAHSPDERHNIWKGSYNLISIPMHKTSEISIKHTTNYSSITLNSTPHWHHRSSVGEISDSSKVYHVSQSNDGACDSKRSYAVGKY